MLPLSLPPWPRSRRFRADLMKLQAILDEAIHEFVLFAVDLFQY